MMGSPPRMRGAVQKANGLVVDGRITPAYAGSRTSCPESKLLRKDHPRVCGEQFMNEPIEREGLGSPPRMRGAELNSKEVSHEHRITPAYAGSSYIVVLQVRASQDHPRVCGEQL